MAMTGVLRPGHTQLRVLDLDESIEFYSNVLGLIQTGREGDRAYFKAWDERDHNSIILRQADTAGLSNIAATTANLLGFEKHPAWDESLLTVK